MNKIDPHQEDHSRTPLRDLRFTGPDVAADIREKYGFDGDLLDFFAGNTGPVVDKWHHYIPLYERYFGRFRNRAVRFLEIGVFKGGSLQMWRKYFGPEATIFGIDIDPRCAAQDGLAGQVRIGSQDDPEFLASVIDEMGGVDVVLDDGSHRMEHIRATLTHVFPRLSMEGVYMIEDLHTAYWRRFGGGTRKGRSFFHDVAALIDDMHGTYHDMAPNQPEISAHLGGVHVHDSIVVLEKARVYQPVSSRVGG